jgi:hypothetical protein
MLTYTATTTIDAPPEKIWRILTDAAGYTNWDPTMIRLEGSIAPGQQLTIYSKVAPNRAFKPSVTEFEPNRKMVWSSGMPLGLFKGARTFTLTPKGANKTEFNLREEFSGLMLPLIGRSIPDLTKTFEEFAAGLKTAAEKA